MSKFEEEVKKEIELKEKKEGRKLSPKGIKKVEKRVKRRLWRQRFVRGILLALGIGVGVAGVKGLGAGKGDDLPIESKIDGEELLNDNGKEFRESIIVTEEQIHEQEEQNRQEGVMVNASKKIFNDIIRKYNDTYNTDLSIDDVGIIESDWPYVIKDAEGNYVEDPNRSRGSEKEEVIEKKGTLVLVNRDTYETICGIGKIGEELKNIEVIRITTKTGTVYNENMERGNIKILDGKTEEEQEAIYEAVNDRFEEILKEKENEGPSL